MRALFLQRISLSAVFAGLVASLFYTSEASAYIPALRRYPYLTDAVGNSITVTGRLTARNRRAPSDGARLEAVHAPRTPRVRQPLASR